MDNIEKLKFIFKLKPSILKSKNKAPLIICGVNDKNYVEQEVRPDETGFAIISFDVELEEGEHEVFVKLVNKETNRDTVLKDGTIVDDLNCEIISLSIDEIDLENLLRQNSQYYIDTPVNMGTGLVSEIPGHTFLSWNGTFRMKLKSPFYFWLLENL